MSRAVITLALMCTLVHVASADSFDLASYTAPTGWSPQDTKTSRAFTTIDKQAGTFCRITLHASMATLGSARKDFDADWRDLIAKPFKPTAAPKIETGEASGWKVTAGIAPFAWEQREAVASLVMMTSATKRFAVSYVATADCMNQLTALIGSLQLGPVEPAATPVTKDKPAAGGSTLAVHKDFVEARQDKIVVRLHFATAIPDNLRGDPEAKRDHFWATYVAPRYADVRNVRKPRIEAYATSEMLEADAMELVTKQRVHVAFHMFTSNGVVSGVEIVAPSKDVLDAAYADAEKVAALRDLNRFAMSAKEMAGTWRDSTGSFLEYYNIYTGNSAGLAMGASTYTVRFDSKGTFASQVKAVAGRAGNLSFGKENRSGSWKIIDGWRLVTKSGAVTRSYDGWFEAVRGGRVLHLVDQKKTAMHDVLILQK